MLSPRGPGDVCCPIELAQLSFLLIHVGAARSEFPSAACELVPHILRPGWVVRGMLSACPPQHQPADISSGAMNWCSG